MTVPPGLNACPNLSLSAGAENCPLTQRVLLQRLLDAFVDQIGALLDRQIAATVLEFHPAHRVDLLAGDAAVLPPLVLLGGGWFGGCRLALRFARRKLT